MRTTAILALVLGLAQSTTTLAQAPDHPVLEGDRVTRDRVVEGLSRDLHLQSETSAPSMGSSGACELDIDWRSRGALPLVSIGIEFPVNSSDLSPGAERMVQEIGAALTDPRLQGVCVQIEGHTDADGPRDFNLQLSLERAESVARYLSSRFGIRRDRIVTVGHGPRYPLADNGSQWGRQRNRRVDLVNLGAPR